MEPEDYPDKRGALIGDFRNYLSILKAVHSGADLVASAQVLLMWACWMMNMHLVL